MFFIKFVWRVRKHETQLQGIMRGILVILN